VNKESVAALKTGWNRRWRLLPVKASLLKRWLKQGCYAACGLGPSASEAAAERAFAAAGRPVPLTSEANTSNNRNPKYEIRKSKQIKALITNIRI